MRVQHFNGSLQVLYKDMLSQIDLMLRNIQQVLENHIIYCITCYRNKAR